MGMVLIHGRSLSAGVCGPTICLARWVKVAGRNVDVEKGAICCAVSGHVGVGEEVKE